MKIKFLITPYLIKNEAFKGIFRIMKICFILLFVSLNPQADCIFK